MRIWIVILALVAALALALCAAGLSTAWALLAGVNVTAVLLYGYDKHRARVGKWRVPEATLHVLAAAGGTPGAFVAQLLFHHKTRDRRFRIIFFAIAAAQVIALLVIYQQYF